MLEYAGANSMIRLSGEVNFGNAHRLHQDGLTLIHKMQGPIVMDLQDVSRYNSVLIALLLDWFRLARRSGQVISYRHVPEGIKQMLPNDLVYRTLFESEEPRLDR